MEYIYASAATQPCSPQDLGRLLVSARLRNRVVGVSGLLLYHERSFLQVLEGEAVSVEAVYQRISADPRHGKLVLLHKGDLERRRFAAWEMGFLGLQVGASCPDGFTDFLRNGNHGMTDPGRVARVLAAFRDGSYHPTIR